MEKWLYKTANGNIVNASEIAEKDINGRVYVDGIEYRLVTGELGYNKKQVLWNKALGKLFFSFSFFNSKVDIPYEE